MARTKCPLLKQEFMRLELRKRSRKGTQASYNREEELPGFGSLLSVRSKAKQNITM